MSDDPFRLADLAVEDAVARRRLPRCGCGPPAIAFLPGTDALRQMDLFVLSAGERADAWCGACWPCAERPIA